MKNIIKSRPRAVVASIFAIAGLAMAAAMPASAAAATAPATGFAAHATAYQNAVLEDAMAAHPGGVRISASKVKWPDGTAATPATSHCEDGHFCGYAGSGYTGNYAWISAEYGWFPLGQCSPVRYAGCDSGVHSRENISGYRTWLEQYPGSGNELCIAHNRAGGWRKLQRG
jgi:hypothetical protein